MPDIIGQYNNGNYTVTILSDGTKIRYNKLDNFKASRPESVDYKITGYCDMNCPFCHENSSMEGEHGHILFDPFIKSLKPFTELAIGGGNPLSHPDIIQFLEMCKEKKLIASMTVNQNHFEKNVNALKKLCDNNMIYGLGISITNPTDKFIETAKQFPNAVIHIIAGVVTEEQLKKLYDNNLKILILGYKRFRRGNNFYSESVQNRVDFVRNNLTEIIKHFNTVSFDNLAISQLSVKNIMTEKDWTQFYMGDDGQFTMYVDAVRRVFAVSSTSETVYQYNGRSTAESMFRRIRG